MSAAPPAASSAAHYAQTRAFHDRAAREREGFYDWPPGPSGPPRHSRWQRRARALVLAALRASMPSRAPDALLDVGCGRGDFSRALKSAYPAARVVGVDFSEDMLALARAQSPTDLEFRAASLPALDLGRQVFDAVVCLNVLHHVRADDQPAALAALCRHARTAVILEIKNARCPYKWLPRGRWLDAATRVYPTTAGRVAAAAAGASFAVAARRPLFGLQAVSPIVVLTLLRTAPT